MTKIFCDPIERISQGDIFRDVDYIESYNEHDGIIEISQIRFPHVIVLTQDCDLAQDFKYREIKGEPIKDQDKIIISALVAPLYNEEFVIKGEHLSELGLKMREFPKKNSTAWKDLINNKNPRYHYFKFGRDSPIPPSIIDFKHYFSINVERLAAIKRTHNIFKVKELYREDISQRFSSFLSRIGLPE